MSELFGNLPGPTDPVKAASSAPAMPSPAPLQPAPVVEPKPVQMAPTPAPTGAAAPVVPATQQVASVAPAPAPVVEAPKPAPVPEIAPEVTEEPEEEKPDELMMLKQRARLMGVNFSNNIGLEALKLKLENKLSGKADEPEPLPTDEEVIAQASQYEAPPQKKLTTREYLLKENMRLIRLRITNLDPKKKDLPGEILTVANRFIGTVRKYVPFGEVTDNGYHVPYVIYKMLKKREFLNIRVVKRNGREHIETNYAREFALEVLPPLTPTELAQLATTQQAQAGINA